MSKAQHYNEGERNTKYFMSQAKKRALNKTMLKVNDEKGRLLTNPNQILERQSEFYATLYQNNKQISFNLVNTTGVKITEEDKKEIWINQLR